MKCPFDEKGRIPVKKEPFDFEYTIPCSDWYEIVKVHLEEDSYVYYRIERRYGPTWWLIGKNYVDEQDYHWRETQIGKITKDRLKEFIEWAKDDNGSRIIEIKAISGSIDILEEMKRLLN